MGIKVEEKADDLKYSNIYEVLNESEYSRHEHTVTNNIQNIQVPKPKTADNYVNPWYRAVDSVFDSIFKGFYYKSNKQIIIQKLVEKL